MQTKATHSVTLPGALAQPGWEVRTDKLIECGCVYKSQRHLETTLGYPVAVSVTPDGYRLDFAAQQNPVADAFYHTLHELHYRANFDFKLDHKAKIVWLTDLCLSEGVAEPGDKLVVVKPV